MRYFINLRRLFTLLALICTACGTALPSVKPFKLEVQQGNVVTSKMLLQLRPGMTKSQVRFIMGSPLIQDSFHGKRWDYAYQLREGGKLKEQRRVILDFENDLLKTVRGDVMAAGSPEAAAFAAKDAADAKANDKKITDTKPADITENPSANKLVEPKVDGKMVVPPMLVPDATMPEANVAPESTLVPTATVDQPVMPVSGATEVPDAIAPLTPAEEVAPTAASSIPMAAEASLPPVAPPVEQVAPEPVVSAQPVIEPSVLEQAPEASLPVDVPAVEQVAPEPVVSAPPVIEPSVTKSSVLEPAAEVSEPALAAPALPEASITPDGYKSGAGMLFDRSLKVTPEATDAVKSGNDVPPSPKALPAESESSFFDRMLEKIGF